MAGLDSAVVQPIKKDIPADPGRRKVLRLIGVGLGFAAGTVLGLTIKPLVESLLLPEQKSGPVQIPKFSLVEEASAQTSTLTLAKVNEWLKNAKMPDFKSAPFGDKTISINEGTSSLALGSKTLDISEGLKTIGVQALGKESKIIYGGEESGGGFRIYFLSDVNAHGILKISVSTASGMVIPEGMANNAITIGSGFSLAAASNSLATAAYGPRLTFSFFDFGERKMRPMDLKYTISEQPILFTKTEAGKTYLVLSAKTVPDIFVYDCTLKSLHIFTKK